MQIVSPLDTGWEVAERQPAHRDLFTGDAGEKLWIPAIVPGHVHLDLVRAGVIADPNWRLAEIGCRWVDEAGWTYRNAFTVTAERLAARGQGRHFLLFQGVDTLARIYLNGRLLGETDNFFTPYRFEVTEHLKVGENELRVEIDSALEAGRARAAAYLGDGSSERGKQHYFNFPPRAFVRKPQYMFGWDWGPELISCGLHGAVELVTVPVAELTDWRCDYRFTGPDTVDVDITLTVTRYESGTPLTTGVALYAPGDNTPELPVPETPGTYTLRLPTIVGQKVTRWNPAGTGPQRRYLLNLRVWRTLDDPDDEKEFVAHQGVSVGFREIELVRERDADGQGEGFRFKINGTYRFIKGANWIPDGCFPGAIPARRLRERLTQARDAGFNMLRVWGGGLYESDEFYSLCDELGLMVWQDFPFACSSYPDDDPLFVRSVRAEATAAVRRLRHRASLAMWCGGNENLELHQGRWSGAKQATRFFGDRIIHEVLPEVLAAEDPAHPFWPNTPYGDDGSGNAQNENYGTAHYWNVWHAKEPTSNGDWTNYAKSNCRFSSEFGFAAPAGPAAWESCLAPEDRTVRSLASKWHDKTRKGYETYLGFIAMHFPEPDTFYNLIYYGQANQAMALSFGIEHWRGRAGRCGGTLFWQLNDCWPTHSWAVIDSAGDPKLAYWAVKRIYAPLLLSLARTGRGIEAHLVNDTDTPIEGHLTLRLTTFDGEEVTRTEGAATAPANAASGALEILDIPGFVADSGTDVFVHATFADAAGALIAENFLLLAEPKDLRLSDPGISCQLTDGAVEVTARRFAAFVTLRFDGLALTPTLSDNGFFLAPGQTRRIALGPLPEGVTAESLAARLRVRHL